MVVHLKKKNIIYRDDYFNKYYKDGKMDKNAPLVINIDGLLVKVKDLPDLALNNKNEVLGRITEEACLDALPNIYYSYSNLC